MPIVYLGRQGGADTSSLVQHANLGRQAALREKEYQQELALIQRQIQQQDAEQGFARLYGEALAEQGQLKQAKGVAPAAGLAGSMLPGPQGAALKLWAEGIGQTQEQQVTVSYLLAQQPEALEMYARMRPEVRSRFERDINERAALQMQTEQLQKVLTKAQGAEGVFLPQGWTETMAADVQAGMRKPDDVGQEYIKQRETYGKQQAATNKAQETVAGLEQVLQMALPRIQDPDAKDAVMSLWAQIQGELQVDPTEVDQGLVGRLNAALSQGLQGAPASAPQADPFQRPADAVRGMWEQAQGAGQLQTPMQGMGGQPGPNPAPIAIQSPSNTQPAPIQGPTPAAPAPVQAQQAQAAPAPRAKIRMAAETLKARMAASQEVKSFEEWQALLAELGLTPAEAVQAMEMALEAPPTRPGARYQKDVQAEPTLPLGLPPPPGGGAQFPDFSSVPRPRR